MRVRLPKGATPSADPILGLLKNHKTIAVVGLSSNPMRPSFGVTEYMQKSGYRIIPVNPNETEVLGQQSYTRLEDVPEKVDIVNIFRQPEDVPPVVESAIRIGAKVVWMQQGIENEEAAAMGLAAGLVVIEDACILAEHKKRVASMEKS